MDIKILRQKIVDGNYELTAHAEEEKDTDEITHKDIRNAFFTGKIIKTFTHNIRGIRYLVEGYTLNNEKIHIVCRILPSGKLRIITVYKIKKGGERNLKRMTYDNCEYCNGKVVEEKLKVNFWWGNKLTIIEDVPVGVCEKCGERYYDAKISQEIEKIALSKKVKSRSMTIKVKNYKEAIISKII